MAADCKPLVSATVLHLGKTPCTFRKQGDDAIAIAASLIALALAGLIAALAAAKTGGIARVFARTLTVVLMSLTGALLGFFVPLIPLPGGVHGSALSAGVLGTLGAIGGMSVAEYSLSRIGPRIGASREQKAQS